mmetsp:Transcript_13703/g.47715  ORF Transcript_13703/g.47715 Transcript_13703/m.47715 type:complete len:237 (-) Transcript_13703:645-1355(-)
MSSTSSPSHCCSPSISWTASTSALVARSAAPPTSTSSSTRRAYSCSATCARARGYGDVSSRSSATTAARAAVGAFAAEKSTVASSASARAQHLRTSLAVRFCEPSRASASASVRAAPPESSGPARCWASAARSSVQADFGAAASQQSELKAYASRRTASALRAGRPMRVLLPVTRPSSVSSRRAAAAAEVLFSFCACRVSASSAALFKAPWPAEATRPVTVWTWYGASSEASHNLA